MVLLLWGQENRIDCYKKQLHGVYNFKKEVEKNDRTIRIDRRRNTYSM